jgi:hypothetical protein
MRVGRVLLSSVTSPALQYFSILYYNRHYFRKKVMEHKMCVLIFFTTFVWNISNSKKNSVRYCHKCAEVSKQSTRYSLQISIQLEFSRKIFEKHSNIKFHENPSSEVRVVPYGRTDDMTKLTVAFSNFANALNNLSACSVPFCPPINLTWVSRDRTRSSAVGSRRQPARPFTVPTCSIALLSRFPQSR